MHTAYPAEEARLGERVRKADVDAEAFRKLRFRECAECHGMCCYDGVYLSEESADTVEAVAEKESGFFESIGLALPEKPVVREGWRGKRAGKKTATREAAFSEKLSGSYPEHFDDTACVFLTEEGLCGLELLSREKEGRHPWHHKPISCWLHPVSVEPAGDPQAGGRPLVTLHDGETDPYGDLSGYNGFVSKTRCGKARKDGAAGHEIFEEELRFLSRISGRDLRREIIKEPGSVRPEKEVSRGS